MKPSQLSYFARRTVFAAIITLLSACGGGSGDGGTSGGAVCENAPSSPSPTLPPLTSPATVQVSVTVSDIGVAGGTLHYQWKSTDGTIADVNAPTTTWSLPGGPGLHFAYVLVSNGYGGYTERRIAVNTDSFGLSAVVPTPVDYVAPVKGLPTGNYLSSYIDGNSIFSNQLYGASEFRTNKPDVLVYVKNNITNQVFPAGGTANPVKTDIRGQFIIPGVLPQPEPADPNIAYAYDIQCSADAGATWGSCGGILAMPDYALNERSKTGRISEYSINGRFRLADKTACGVVNEFFDKQSTPTATLLNQLKIPLGNPIRISEEGDYTFPQRPEAAFVQINCESNPPVLIPVGQNDVTMNRFLGIATLSKVRAPTIDTMTAMISSVSVGQFLPPPSGLPSDLLPDKGQFLSYRGLDTRKGACQYYKAIGAVKNCDAQGNLVGAISFDDWQRTTRMGKYAAAGTTEYVANYINQVDLNLTRNHHSISYGPGDTAAYVCNYLGPKDASPGEINTAIDNSVKGKNLVACVAMDHRASPGVNNNQAFTRFLVFGPSGNLLPSINLDGRSEKFVPGTCVVCHGGDKYAGKFPEDSSGYADIGAHFLPYDVGNFAFSCQPGLTRANQEEAIYHLNQNVLDTGPTPAALELIIGWYADGTHKLNDAYLPSSWEEANLPVERQGRELQNAYYTLVAHSCRTCHVNLAEEYNFDHYVNMAAYLNSTVCGNTSNQLRAYSMPNSLVTFNRFWQSPAQIAAYEKIKSSCKLTNSIDLKIGDLSAGDAHTININADGTLWARGNNQFGQLGDGTKVSRATPVQVTSDLDWINVATGANHSLAIKADGSLWAWGDNSSGQLGDGSTISRQTPVKVIAPAGIINPVWRLVVAGERHTVGIVFDPKLGDTLWAWGDNTYGQLGINSSVTNVSQPTQVGNAVGWLNIAAGANHTLGIQSAYDIPNNAYLRILSAWGDNSYGQLGLGEALVGSKIYTPSPVGSDTNWSVVSAGKHHSMASNYVAIPNNYASTLWLWGDNTQGQLGDNTTTSQHSPSQLVNTIVNWSPVAAAGNHTIATSSAGLQGWGDNSKGQLGNNSTITPFVPVVLDITNSFNWVDTWGHAGIGAGSNHTVMWDFPGYLWAWGDNSFGQLGDGTTVGHLLPTRSLMAPIISSIPAATSIRVGFYYQYNFSGFSPDSKLLTYNFESLPTWLTYTVDSGLANTVIISGTPVKVTPVATPDQVVLTVSDGVLTTKYSIKINVVP